MNDPLRLFLRGNWSLSFVEMEYPKIKEPDQFIINKGSIIVPSEENKKIDIIRGPNIKPLPEMEPLPETLEVEVGIKVGDNISTDTIMPAGSKVLPLRSNIEAISEYVFYQIDPGFHDKCQAGGNMAVIGGENYGQGSSREHAALAPRFLGVRVKIAKSFARIHKANLCNFGILPLTFKNPEDYDRINKDSKITLKDIRRNLSNNDKEIPVDVDGMNILTVLDVSDRQRKFLLAGSALNYIKEELHK